MASAQTPQALSPQEVNDKLTALPLGTKITLSGFTPVGEFTDTGFLALHDGAFHLARDKRGTQLVPFGAQDVSYTDITVRDSSVAPTERLRAMDAARAQQRQRVQQQDAQAPRRQPSAEPSPPRQQAPPAAPAAPLAQAVHTQDTTRATEAGTQDQLRLLIQQLTSAMAQGQAPPERPERVVQGEMPVEVLARLASALTGPRGVSVLAEEAGTPTLTVAPFRAVLRPFALWTYAGDPATAVAAWRTDVLAVKSELGIHLHVPHGLQPDAARKAQAAVDANHSALRFAERLAADQLMAFARAPLTASALKDEWYPVIAAGIALLAALATARRTFIEGGGRVLLAFEDQWFSGEMNLGALQEKGFRH